MKKHLTLVLCLVLALTVQGCRKGKKLGVFTKSGSCIQFKSLKLVQRGYIWDSRYGNVDLYNKYGAIGINRDLAGLTSLVSLGIPEQNKGVIVLSLTYKDGRSILGLLPLHSNKGWDYIEVTTHNGIQNIPIEEISYIEGK